MSKQSWQVDAAHSTVSFSVRHMVISKVKGKFAKWTAKLDLDTANLAAASVEVEIDAASIDTGVADRDAHLRSADFFDTAKYPTLTYKSRSVTAAGADKLQVVGDLTLHGVTREVALAVEVGGQGKDPWGNVRAGFTAKGSLNRKEFGLGWNQALETGGVLVAEKIDIEIELQAIAGK